MTIVTRLGALGALSILAACGTSTGIVNASGDPVDVSEVFAAAATFTPTEETGDTSIREAAESEDGFQTMVGLRDGTLVPLTLKIDNEANTLSVSFGDGEPIVFENTNPEGGSSSWYSEVDGYVYLYNYGSSGSFYGNDINYVPLNFATAAVDLPESGEVGYSGYFEMEADEDSGAYGSLALAVNFGSGAVTGGIVGSTWSYDEYDECCERILIEEEEEDGPIYDAPSGDSFFGTVEGSVEGNLLAATSEFSGGTVDGSVGMLGAFGYGGSDISGGIAGTIDGTTMGGTFEAYAGEGGGPR